jgi:hypothetical protein
MASPRSGCGRWRRAPPDGAPALAQREHGGGDEADDDDAGGVLRGGRQPEAEPRDHVIAVAAEAQDPRGPVEGQRDRRQGRCVVEREMPVVDGQEGDRQQRARERARPPVLQQAGRGHRGQDDRGRAEGRGGGPRDLEGLRGIACERAHRGGAAPEPAPEHAVDEVGVGGRVDEVARVVVVAEEPDRPRDEMRLLVDVVDQRQAAPESPEAQRERARGEGEQGEWPGGFAGAGHGRAN